MSEIVERVARVLSRRHFMRKRQISWQTSEFQEAWVARLVEDHWRNHEQDAKDAIEAMREPTQRMIDAGATCPGDGNLDVAARMTWEAMIDGAMK